MGRHVRIDRVVPANRFVHREVLVVAPDVVDQFSTASHECREVWVDRLRVYRVSRRTQESKGEARRRTELE